jgi:serine/threonine-protein kinase
MPVTDASSFLETLARFQLLAPAQLEELTGGSLDLDARRLARELVGRNWLTPFQVNLLLQGRGADLFLGPYTILERLGEGGAGQVFKARHQRMNRLVALKLIRRELVADAEVVARFLREIQVVSQLSHPNVVHAYDAGPVGPTYFLAMEYVEGIDLGRLVKANGPLPVATACDYVRQGALGLQHAHERGLVHRDIKPPNFLVAPGSGDGPGPGLVKLLDLGLARLQRRPDGDRTSVLTQAGPVMMGTPDYLAPEQALDFRGVDIRADIYGLGCTLYYLLTARPPFPGGSLAQKLLRHQQAEFVPVERFRTDVPASVTAVLRRMLAKHPDDRPQTPREVADALSDLAKAAGLSVDPPELIDDRTIADELSSDVAISLRRENAVSASASTLSRVPEPTTSTLADRIRRPTRRRWLWASLAAAPLLGVPLLMVFAGPGLSPAPPSTPNVAPAPAAVVPATAPPPSPAEQNYVFAAWNEPKADRERLRPELLHILRTRPASPAARQAAACLRRLPSGLDRLGANAIPAEKRDPPELVAQVGDPRPGTDGVRIAFSPDGQWLATAGDDAKIRLWRTATLAEPPLLLSGHTARVAGLAFSPSGQILASFAVGDLMPTLWDLTGPVGAPIRIQPPGHNAPLRAMAFSPDATMLVTAGNGGTIRFRDLTAKGYPEIAQRTGHVGAVTALAFSPDGRTLASTGTDQTVRLWEGGRLGLRTEKLQLPNAHQKNSLSLAYSPDGKILVVAGVAEPSGVGGVSLWACDATATPPRQLWDIPGRIVSAIAFSPDGKSLAVCFANGEIIVQDTTDWRRTRQWHRAKGVHSLEFAPDGRHLAVGDADGVVSLLRLESFR